MTKEKKATQTDRAQQERRDDPSSGGSRRITGERLKKARAALRLTQREPADTAGMPLPSHKDYEWGKRTPGGDALAAYARAGINVQWLLTGEGEMLVGNRAVREGAATHGQAPTGGAEVHGESVDLELLERIIELVEEGTAHYPAPLKPDKKARLILALYERAQIDLVEHRPVDPQWMLRLLRSLS